MLTSEYRDRYGKNSLTSDEYRKERSEKNKGINNPNYGNRMSQQSKDLISLKNKDNIPWNRGLKFDDTSTQKEAVKKRETRYESGELERFVPVHSETTKDKISRSVIEYAKKNPEELLERSKKAIQTKRDNGYDFAFFKGRKHNTETKQKISEKSTAYGISRREKSVQAMKERLTELGFKIVATDLKCLTAICNVCSTEVTYTKQMFQPSKIRDKLCFSCYPRETGRSIAEIELFEFINQHIHAEHTFKFDNTKRSLDIFIPSKKIAIEFHGLYYHSQQHLESIGQSKLKDFEKLKDVNNLGIRLVQVYEDEWLNKKEIVKNRLLKILGVLNEPTIFARKCRVREIIPSLASEFCNRHHLQGAGRSNIRLGLFFEEALISVMTFSSDNISRKVSQWELNRFCSANYNIPGAASKLFSYFVKNYNPEHVITYADRRWSVGDLYVKLGFSFERYTVPGYWYLKDNLTKRIHRYSLRKTENDPIDVTERELRIQEGYRTIWDSGNSKWIWKSPLQKFPQE